MSKPIDDLAHVPTHVPTIEVGTWQANAMPASTNTITISGVTGAWNGELHIDPSMKLNRNALAAWAAHNGLLIVGAESHKEMLAELESLRMEVLKLRAKPSNGPERLSDDVWRRVMRFG